MPSAHKIARFVSKAGYWNVVKNSGYLSADHKAGACGSEKRLEQHGAEYSRLRRHFIFIEY
ncbi:hypothetical protein [Mucilaginibacter flavidus]|uniref:hypothetical protein n=1 Tax=Mucilaginibacter flavidus TaxID=2949309 RepID=UPI002092D7DB|nr:hypothetical protein [Mucilaginibacter flavidus]